MKPQEFWVEKLILKRQFDFLKPYYVIKDPLKTPIFSTLLKFSKSMHMTLRYRGLWRLWSLLQGLVMQMTAVVPLLLSQLGAGE